MEYVTFIIAVDVPRDFLEEEDDDEKLYEMIETQIREQNGFHIIGTMPYENSH